MISAQIDVTKIDKARLYTGKKGVYLNVVLIETPDSDYGDYMIVEDIPHKERLEGKRGEILGNAKIKTSSQNMQGSPKSPNDDVGRGEAKDLPF